MKIQIICIGKLKEKYWSDAVAEYSKRLKRFANLEIIELKEARLPDNASPADEEKVKLEEGKSILSKISDSTYVITLEVLGKQLSSEELAEKMDDLANMGRSDIAFVIGGSLGLSAEVSKQTVLQPHDLPASDDACGSAGTGLQSL